MLWHVGPDKWEDGLWSGSAAHTFWSNLESTEKTTIKQNKSKQNKKKAGMVDLSKQRSFLVSLLCPPPNHTPTPSSAASSSLALLPSPLVIIGLAAGQRGASARCFTAGS